MRQHDRYLFRELVVPFWIGLLAFLMMLVGNTLFQVLDQMIRDRWPVGMVARALLFNVPTALQLALPIACALAPGLAIARLARDSELIALRAHGVSLRRAMLPVFVFGALVGAGGAVLTERVVPWAWREQNNIEGWLANLPVSSLDSSLTFSLDNYTISWWKMSRIGPRAFRMDDVTVLDRGGAADAGRRPRAYTAERGEYRDGLWTLYGVSIHEFDAHGKTLWDARAARQELALTADFTRGLLHFTGEQLQNLSFAELSQQLAVTVEPRRKQELDTARWFKFALPALCAPLALLAAPLALAFSRAGGVAGVVIALLLTLVGQLLLVGMQALSLSGRAPAPLAAAAPALALLTVALILLRRRE